MAAKRQAFLIIGLGLIGGSLAGAIRKRIPKARVLGLSRDSKKIALAKKRKLIHDGSTRLSQIVPKADFIFICSPVDTIPKLIFAVNRFAKRGAVVTDVGSTKKDIVNAAERMSLSRIHFIGSHPLAGSHLTGLEHATPDLFKGAFVFVTPTQKTNRKTLRSVSSVWKRLGASVQIILPQKHDQMVSQISHLPHAVASLLVEVINPKTLRFAGTGFRDTTRIAQGDARIWAPIFVSNRSNLIADLRKFKSVLDTLLRSLKKGSLSRLSAFLKAASSKRAKI
jgi:prephenate dehydrogenase